MRRARRSTASGWAASAKQCHLGEGGRCSTKEARECPGCKSRTRRSAAGEQHVEEQKRSTGGASSGGWAPREWAPARWRSAPGPRWLRRHGSGRAAEHGHHPPREFGPGAPNVYFWDADVIAVDPSFNGLAQPNAPIQRLWTGALWAEGPAWNSVGKFLVWSDIPNNRQLRWIEDDGHVSVFRMPSNNSNGNTFDFQGRQISCEHLTRRVVRYELDGSITVLADSWNGKRLNSPNDAVPHPDGSVWFTDPPYGAQLYEGTPDPAGGKSNPEGRLNNRVGQPVGVSDTKQELPTQVYRWDPSGRVDVVIPDDKVPNPNGLCFSHDYKKMYVASTGTGRQGRHPCSRRR